MSLATAGWWANLRDSLSNALGVLANPIRNQQVGTADTTTADGSDITLGAQADPPATTATTDPWTGISLLKGLLKIWLDVWNSITHTIGVTFTNTTIAVTQGTAANLNATVTGTVTANASTNLNTSLLALETGGNLATLVARDTNSGTVGATTARVVQASVPVLNVTQASVLVTNTTVIGANTKRAKVRVINTSTNPLWIGPTNPATIGNGAYIPGIAGYPWSTRYEGALYAIATGGTALVTVDEESAS